MLAIANELHGAKLPQQREALTRQMAATHGRIDRLVYDLYGLTEEEIALVDALRGRCVALPAWSAICRRPRGRASNWRNSTDRIEHLAFCFASGSRLCEGARQARG